METALVKIINILIFFLALRIKYAHLERGEKEKLNSIPDIPLKTEIA